MHYDKENIKKNIIEFNKNHYWKAFDSKICNSRMHNNMEYNNVRDKIFQGIITREEYKDNNIYSFVILLKDRMNTK